MIKKTIAVLIALMLVPFAFALEEGETLTQTQVNNFPINNYNTVGELATLFECQYEGDGFSTLYNHVRVYTSPFSCFTLKQISPENYIITRKTFYPFVQISTYKHCVSVLDDRISFVQRKEFCEEYAQEILNAHAKGKIKRIKKNIVSYQDEADDGTTLNVTGGFFS